MPEGRPSIPRELRRDILVEAGHRCAIPACRQHPVEVEHIDDWAKVKEHRFENLIALCPTCHARKGEGPGQIDRKSLRQYKANLAILNSRYGDVERRLIEYCAQELARGREGRPFGGLPVMTLGFASEWQVMYLLADGYLERYPVPLRPSLYGIPLTEQYILTEAGADFVQRWMQARPLEPLTSLEVLFATLPRASVPSGAGRAGMSAVVAMVSSMPRNLPGVTGRYQAKCGRGLCALAGDQATSKLQGDLFALLDYVIGGGAQDVRAGTGTRTLRTDMVFRLPGVNLPWSSTVRTGMSATRTGTSARHAPSRTATSPASRYACGSTLSSRPASGTPFPLTCRSLLAWMPGPVPGWSCSTSST